MTDPIDERSPGERYYDEIVAPALAKIMDLCNTHGMTMVAVVQYDPNGAGRSEIAAPDAPPISAAMRLALYGARCNGNADTLIHALIRDGRANGHNSVFLARLEHA